VRSFELNRSLLSVFELVIETAVLRRLASFKLLLSTLRWFFINTVDSLDDKSVLQVNCGTSNFANRYDLVAIACLDLPEVGLADMIFRRSTKLAGFSEQTEFSTLPPPFLFISYLTGLIPLLLQAVCGLEKQLDFLLSKI
jgi:hypothetical protein